MPYPEILIKPMREDLTRFGVEETRTPEDLDEVIRNTKGTVMIVVNSVCGCAAGDIAATERARSYFKGYFPWSPSVGILQDGKITYMLERHQIEGRDPQAIARDLTQAFDRLCAPSVK